MILRESNSEKPGTVTHEAIASIINDENVDAASRRVQATRVRFYIYFQSNPVSLLSLASVPVFAKFQSSGLPRRAGGFCVVKLDTVHDYALQALFLLSWERWRPRRQNGYKNSGDAGEDASVPRVPYSRFSYIAI